MTGDKDFFQLVHDGLKVYNPKEDGHLVRRRGRARRSSASLPEQVVDVLALMGDSIDNIKGVPGIGEKGARDLIATYGNLEALLAKRREISNKRYREGLLNHAEDARQSRELARIRTDVPVEFDPEAVRYRGARRDGVLRAVHEARLPVAGDGVRADGRNRRQATTRSLTSPDGAADAGDRAADSRALRASRDPRRPAAMRAGIVGIAFSTAARRARYVPVVGCAPAKAAACSAASETCSSERALDLAEVLDALEPVLEDPSLAEGRPRPEVRRDRARRATA